ncbi:MAG: phosphate regulon sensor protein PhoR [Nitrosomonas sp.]|nr:MAG: phosphate regulon sensor protein PhoR [Nitrosomonas sp.]
MFDFWRRSSGIVFLIFITFVLWAISDAVIALTFFSVSLLLMMTLYIHHLVALDRWLRSNDLTVSSIPDAAGAWGEVFAALARFVRQHSQSQKRLSLVLERMQRATSAMPDGVVMLDEDEHIEWCNSMAEKHLGISLELDTGRQITNLVRQMQFAEHLAAKDFSRPLILKHSRHHELVLSLQLVPYGFQQKLLISRDITRFEKVETMRRDFIANISHELRTPLTVIGGFLETLSEEEQTDTAMNKQALSLMSGQAKRMQRLVEDLLTLSRLENALNLMKEKKVDVGKMLHDLAHEAESLSAGHHQIKLDLATDVQLTGSEDELRSAFTNLVTNAIRYTPDGGEIILRWAVQNGQGLFSVQDSGIGIEPEHIPRLTERFYRVDSSRSRETGGTGLGLAIVKHVLNRHQARLEVISNVDKGSRFNVWFPAKRLLLQSSVVEQMM